MTGRPPHPVTQGLHDAAIQNLANRQKSLLKLCRQFKCSRSLIVRRMRVLREEPPIGVTLTSCPYPKTTRRARNHLVAHGHHDGVLIAMAQQGRLVTAIAAKLDCGFTVVTRRLQRLGEVVRI